MSGIKRKIEGNDPDYEDISLVQDSKRNKAAVFSGKTILFWICTPALHVVRFF